MKTCDELVKGLKQHKKHSHPEESKLHVCHVCGYKTPGFSNLKEHIEVKHENVKPFPCNVCDARFYRKTRLEQHVKGMYRISANSFRGNYSFLEVEVRQLFKGGNYSKEETIVFLHFCKNT